MNLRICTGYLTRAAEPAFTAPSPGQEGVRKLIFELHVRDHLGREFPEKCVIESNNLQNAVEAKLLAGVSVLVEGEPTARPFERHGVATGGWVRELIVRRVEFMRLPKVNPSEPRREAA